MVKAVTFNLDNGPKSHVLIVNMDDDVDFVFSNPPPSTQTQSFLIEFHQDPTGNRAINFLDTINGTTPDIDSTSNSITRLVGYISDGSTYNLFRMGEYSVKYN